MKTELTVGLIGILLVTALVAATIGTYRNQQELVSTVTQQLAGTATGQPQNMNGTAALTATTVAQHSTSGDCWIIVSGKVYGVSSYLRAHPGGSAIIVPYCGRDATAAFATKGGQGQHSSNATQLLSGYLIGTLNTTVPTATSQPPATSTSPGTTNQPQSNENEQEDD